MNKQSGSAAIGAFQTYEMLGAVTATTTSIEVPCGNAKRATFEFTRADHVAGSSLFTVEGTVDGGTTWHALDLFPATGAKTRAASVTLSANGSELHAVDLEFIGVQAIRTKVVETTDGTHSARLFLES